MRVRLDGTFLQVNRRFCEWLDFKSEDLVERRRLQDLLTVGGRIFYQTHWSPLLQMQGSLAEVKLEIVTSKGERIPVVMNAVRTAIDGDFVVDVALFVARDRDAYER